MDATTFQSPPATYREIPFWSWNDALDPDELRRQIGLIAEGGWGGFFMHARLGLQTPYLGQRWMEGIRASVDEARQRGLGAWLYDEDKWPSGFAGGLAVANPAYRAQALLCLVDLKPALMQDRVAVFAAQRDRGRLSTFTPITDQAPFDGDQQSLIQFVVQQATLGDPWYNGYTYADLLNPAAVRAFLDSTYERYAAEFDEAFGTTIPGIFTDEPAYLNTTISGLGMTEPGTVQAIPWTTDLPAFFQERWGYDLLPHLPELFFDTGPYPQTRYHFWRFVTERFVASYSRQLAQWCAAHHLQFTGHYLLEEALWVQTRWIGSAMLHYAEQDIPGIDKLCRNLNNPLGPKQLDSVVCQLGKSRALCESYGANGQAFAFKGRKWEGDWLYVLGVTLNNPHLSLYSMRGERKRDYPANLFFQQPWWPENCLIADYFARLSYALTQGQRVVDVLILHPLGSAWSRYRPDATAAVGQLDAALEDLEYALLRGHRDFHLGDELLLAAHATVEHRNGIPVLRVGQMTYRVVVIPPSFTWTQVTVSLIAAFVAQGGPVLALTPLPTEIEGRVVVSVFPQHVQPIDLAQLLAALDAILPADVRLDGAPEVWYQHRRAAETDWYFCCNTDPDHGHLATLTLQGSGRLEDWDSVSGAITALPSTSGATTTLTLDFPPAGSRLLVLHHDQPPVSVPPSLPAPGITLPLADRWSLELSDPNALTLDWAAVRLDDGTWSAPLYILDAHERVRKAGDGVRFALRFTVDVADVPAGPLFLIVETPERFAITLNDQDVANTDHGWWCDPSFRKVAIAGRLVAGPNTVVLSGRFDRETEIESIYLLGQFGVTVREHQYVSTIQGQTFHEYGRSQQLGALPTTLTGADLCAQGLPFFAGRVRLRQTLTLDATPSGGTLAFTDHIAAVAHVRINDVEIGLLAWEPYALDVGTVLRAGENAIEVEVVTTLRNLLGPHHRAGGDPEGVSPQDFRRSAPWTDNYILTPMQVGHGLLHITMDK